MLIYNYKLGFSIQRRPNDYIHVVIRFSSTYLLNRALPGHRHKRFSTACKSVFHSCLLANHCSKYSMHCTSFDGTKCRAGYKA